MYTIRNLTIKYLIFLNSIRSLISKSLDSIYSGIAKVTKQLNIIFSTVLIILYIIYDISIKPTSTFIKLKSNEATLKIKKLRENTEIETQEINIKLRKTINYIIGKIRKRRND
jgi:hypothetical protein